MTENETIKLLTMLGSVWSNELIDDAKITMYYLALSEYAYADLEAAIVVHIRSSTFFPKPAELIAILRDRRPVISHGEAEAQLRKQISAHGRNGFKHVTFDDPVVLAAVNAVGWNRLCDDETKYALIDFRKALDNANERAQREIVAGSNALPGMPSPLALGRNGNG